MTGDGAVLDKGTTTEKGAWALHLTQAESESIRTYWVRAARSRTSSGYVCEAGEGRYR